MTIFLIRQLFPNRRGSHIWRLLYLIQKKPQQTGFTEPQQRGFTEPQQTGFTEPQQTGFTEPQQTGIPKTCEVKMITRYDMI